jgi:sulfopyruvate decarboxylase subunit alpha
VREAVAIDLLEGLEKAGVKVIAWLPDTWLGSAEARATTESAFTSVQVTNEAEGLAVCAGAWLAGARAALLMENTGLLVGVHNLELVCHYYGIPVLMVMSYRGALGDGLWWFSGVAERLEPTLRLYGVPYEVVTNPDRLAVAVSDAVRTMENAKRPVALLLPGVLAA